MLHQRWLKLKEDRAELEILGMEALTEEAGGHPLFNGVPGPQSVLVFTFCRG